MDFHHDITPRPHRAHKKPHDISKMLPLIRKAVKPYAKAMLFELRDRGYDSVFEQLCACVLSIRTFDETSLKSSLRLFERARTPRELAKLDVDEVAKLIFDSTFPRQKATNLLAIARAHLDRDLPHDFNGLTDLPGIGPKCAGLIMGIACGEPAIGVDIHVHRITNRWGYVRAGSPEKTLQQLETKLPRKHWVEINELLVPFGKHICTGKAPKCSTCPVFEYCDRMGVTEAR